MGSIGDTFPYAAPVIGSTNWANWILCMDELIDRVASPVPVSALAGGNLDLDGQSIIDVFGLEFKNSSDAVAATPGLIRYKDNEWYLVTAAGTVQVTSAGVLNAAAIGGIGGDYGTGPEDVRFVNASQRYDFWDDFAGNAYGYVRARGFDVNNGAGGANYCRLTYGTAANVTLILPVSVPAANRSVLLVDNAGQISHNAAGTTITNDVYLGNTEIKHTKERSVVYTFQPDFVALGTFLQSGGFGNAAECTAAPGDVFRHLDGLQVGWRIKSIKVGCKRVLADPANFKLYSQVNTVAPVTHATTADVGTGANAIVTITPGAPPTVTANTRYAVAVEGAAVTDLLYSIEVVYDVP